MARVRMFISSGRRLVKRKPQLAGRLSGALFFLLMLKG